MDRRSTVDASGPVRVLATLAPSEMGSVTLTALDLDVANWSPASCRAVLDDAERGAAERLVTRRLAERFVRRRAAVRHLLSERTDCAPDELVLGTAPGGKPSLRPPWADIAFSVSSSRNLCVVAMGDEAAIGVDVQHLEEDLPAPEMVPRTLSRLELAQLEPRPGRRRTLQFFRAWTRKEAMLKTIGIGLTVPPTQVGVDLTARWRTAVWPPTAASPDPGRCSWADLSDITHGACVALMVVHRRPGVPPLEGRVW